MNITYRQNGDYLIPNIVIHKTKSIGHYGRLRKAYPLFLNLCCLLAGLRFLHHTDKLSSVMLGIFCNGFQHFRDKGLDHIFIDTVLGLA